MVRVSHSYGPSVTQLWSECQSGQLKPSLKAAMLSLKPIVSVIVGMHKVSLEAALSELKRLENKYAAAVNTATLESMQARRLEDQVICGDFGLGLGLGHGNLPRLRPVFQVGG